MIRLRPWLSRELVGGDLRGYVRLKVGLLPASGIHLARIRRHGREPEVSPAVLSVCPLVGANVAGEYVIAHACVPHRLFDGPKRVLVLSFPH